MATAGAPPGAVDDEMVFLEEEQGSQEAGEGNEARDQGASKDDGQTQTEHVQEVRLAEGGEPDDDQAGQGEQGQGDGKDGKEAHNKGRKSWRQRQDQYQRAARRAREERDFALQQVYELTQRLGAVEASALETRLLTIDGRLQECQSDADQALTLEVQAQQQGDQDSLRSARLIRERALSRANVLQSERDRLQQTITQRASQPTRPQPPVPGQAEINQLAARFKADKPWLQFRPDGSPANRETAVYHAIDLAMQAEGQYLATEPEYWSELDRRGHAALPHLFGLEDESGGEHVEVQSQQQQSPPRQAQRAAAPGRPVAKGPAVAGSGRQANAGAPQKRLSVMRVEALKELGLWGPNLSPADKKEQAEYIKYFDQHDRENGA